MTLSGTRPQIGSRAPDFELTNQYGEPIRLSALLGRNVVVVFYPFAFSGVCTGELCEIRDNMKDFAADNATVLAISVDSKYTLRAYAESERLDFDLLSDFWPHGAVADRYGVFDPQLGRAERGTFIIDQSGTIRDVLVSPVGQARSLGSYRRALAELG
jgi:peroxiredoxin